MGKSQSKPKKFVNKLSISSKINQEINCPLCNQKFTGNMTYDQLNQHLNRCGKINFETVKKHYSDRRFDFSFDKRINNKSKNKNILQNNRRKLSSLILKEISKNNKIHHSLDNEQRKRIMLRNEMKEQNSEKIIGTFEERYNQMIEYINLKKNHYKTNIIVEGENLIQLLNKLKYSNIYEKMTLILKQNDNEKKFSQSEVVVEYFNFMIESKNIEIINGKTIVISLSRKMDFELFGYFLSLLLIYPECKINYKLPHLICKIILNQKLTLNDIQYENKSLYENLIKIKNRNNFSDLNLYFNYEDNDLVSNGSNIEVDEYNFEEYIDKMIEFEVNKYKKEINIIRGAVFNYIPKNYIMNFKGDELYQIFNRLV